MITATLVASLVGLLLSSVWLLLGPKHPIAARGAVDASRRALTRSVALTVALAPLPSMALLSVGATKGQTIWAGSACAAAAIVLNAPAFAAGAPAARWKVSARLAWTFTVLTGATFLVYTAVWTYTSNLSPLGRGGGFALWLLELVGFLMALAYLWELVDAVGSRWWARRTPEGAPPSARVDGPFPFVSLHVPAHNEPPDMVIETIRSLQALDYPAFEIIVLDNNTTDDSLWQPVADYCASQGPEVTFHRLVDWPGYKSGALNFGLTVTDPRAEVIGVVDSDYVVRPDWLRATAPMFSDERLAFVQSPQDYREWQGAGYYRRLYHSYDYFFRVSQRSRDERDAAIFGGTMGLVRRSALEAVGGWSEWCITEDAELSLRLHKAGWTGCHVDASYGHGVMPLTFEALKGQRFRWCFGGVQILRLHWRSLMPWNRDQDNHLTHSQRLAYLVGGVQWFGDLLTLGFVAFLLIAAVDTVLGGEFVLRRLSPLLLIVVPALVLVGVVRAVAGIRRAGDATWSEALGALGIWMALGFTVARACTRGLIEKNGVFLRTPKTRGDTSLRDAMRMNSAETVIGTACVALAVASLTQRTSTGTALVAGLLVLTGSGFMLAPALSLSARRADLTAALSERRATEPSRGWTPIGSGRAGRGALVLVAVPVAVIALLAPPTGTGSIPSIGLHRGPTAFGGLVGGRSASPSPTRSPSPVVQTQAPTISATPTQQGSPTPSSAPVQTTSPTPSATPTPQPSPTPSASPTQPASHSPSATPTQTATPTHPTPSGGPSSVPSPTNTHRP